MKTRIHLTALSLAIAVNVAAVTAVNVAMVDAGERERLSQQEAERIVITASRLGDPAPQALANQNCRGNETL